LAAQKPDDSFRVIDRRLFNAEGELRPEVAEKEGGAPETPSAKAAPAAPAPPSPAVEAPSRSLAFENLIRMLGSNAAMVLGAYADPRTGQAVVDPEAARELIDMLDALLEKTKGRLAPDEENLLLDLLGKLKITYVEISRAVAAQAAQSKAK